MEQALDILNRYAPAIQALSAVGILLLTGALVWVTWRYVQRVAEQVDLMRQQLKQEQPTLLLRMLARGWQIDGFCMNVGKPNLVLDSISIRLTTLREGKCIFNRKWDFSKFLSPGKSWSQTLVEGIDGTGTIQLPRRTLKEWWRGHPGPAQPSGLMEAAAQYSCGGASYEVGRHYWVRVGLSGAKLSEANPPESSIMIQKPEGIPN